MAFEKGILFGNMSAAEKSSLASFARRMVKRARSLDQNMQQAFRETAAAALTEVVLSTPVDMSPDAKHSGQARGGWTVGVGSRPSGPSLGSKLDPQGNSTLNEGFVEIRQVNHSGQTIYIINDVPYISLLNKGSSQQAPAGFVDKALMRARATFRLRSFLADNDGGRGGNF